MDYNDILTAIYATLGSIPDETLAKAADELKNENVIMVSSDGSAIALVKNYELEQNIARELLRLNVNLEEIYGEDYSCDIKDYEEVIKDLESQQGFEFTDEQIEAMNMSLKHGVLAITGGGGVGKSTIAKGITLITQNRTKGYVQGVALSGKASLRLQEVTGVKCSTIHRYLAYQPAIGFGFNKHNQLFDNQVILDETTMVSGDIFYSLIQAIPTGSQLIILGDIKQLTPIGNCQVFSDVLSSGVIPSIELTKLHRQAQMSAIIPTSISVSKQKQIYDKNFYGEVTLGELQDMDLVILNKQDDIRSKLVDKFMVQYELENNNIMDVQIVTMMRTRGNLSAYELNLEIQNRVNPSFSDTNQVEVLLSKTKNDIKSYKIRQGDKVINMKNNYDTVDIKGNIVPVFNGNIGIVKEIGDDGVAIIEFEGLGDIIIDKSDMKNIHLAYAVTTHKYQGSQCKRVVVGMDNGSYLLNNTEMLYTAITRARKHCTLVGVNSAVRQAIATRELKTKQTFLKDMLIAASNE